MPAHEESAANREPVDDRVPVLEAALHERHEIQLGDPE
jgi:hypothetical protein